MNAANTPNILTYLSPKEVLVSQATILTGTFDPQRVANISILAEDKYPLPVTLNRSAGTWQVPMDKGFTSAGIRWMRLKATDSSGKVVSDQKIYITVSAEPMTATDSLTLKLLRDTFFKAAPVDSATLNEQQKVKFAANETFTVRRYGYESGHLKIELNNGSFGYFYEKHVQLSKGAEILRFETADLPAPPAGTAQLWIAKSTLIKTQPDDSANLASTQIQEVLHGQTFVILGYACVEGHFRVSLLESLPGFGKSGYVYWQHVQIKKDGQLIRFDPDALTLTVLQTTAFKKRPLDAIKLSTTEKYTLSAGTIYGISSYSMESSHLKVAITENLLGFGNTGYLYPDYVELGRGRVQINNSPAIAYTGPTEVLVNQNTVLNGTYNAQQAIAVSVVAEDKYPLPVTLNKSAGTWQVSLTRGFQSAGARWLRVKATNSKGEVVGSQVVNLNVSGDPATVGQSLTLKVLKDTLFKVSPLDSGRLNQQQKTLVKAGQTFRVSKYGFVDGHLKLTLDSAIAPVGNFGYLYEGHVQLSKGTQILRFDIAEVPNTDASAQMLVTQTTLIKAKPEDSTNLATNQIAELILGQTFAITGYASHKGHFRVSLAESIPGFGNVGFIYWQHVQIKKNGKIVPYDPDALTATILQATALKKEPIDASKLSAENKVTLPLGRVYGVDSYAIEGGHIKASLTEEFSNFGNTGYVFPSYVLMRRGSQTFNPIPPQLELNVPYFSQRDNPRFYWSTCNVTSVAMVFYYYGIRSQWGGQLEDELLEWCFNYAGQGSETNHSVLSALIRDYGFKTSFSTTRRWQEIREELINKRPLVLAGDMTPSGHVLTVIGYNSQGLIVNDPWGDALTGYRNTEGRKLFYPYSYLNQVSGPEGAIWAHFISR